MKMCFLEFTVRKKFRLLSGTFLRVSSRCATFFMDFTHEFSRKKKIVKLNNLQYKIGSPENKTDQKSMQKV